MPGLKRESLEGKGSETFHVANVVCVLETLSINYLVPRWDHSFPYLSEGLHPLPAKSGYDCAAHQLPRAHRSSGEPLDTVSNKWKLSKIPVFAH